jgi:hypothetical protein
MSRTSFASFLLLLEHAPFTSSEEEVRMRPLEESLSGNYSDYNFNIIGELFQHVELQVRPMQPRVSDNEATPLPIALPVVPIAESFRKTEEQHVVTIQQVLNDDASFRLSEEHGIIRPLEEDLWSISSVDDDSFNTMTSAEDLFLYSADNLWSISTVDDGTFNTMTSAEDLLQYSNDNLWSISSVDDGTFNTMNSEEEPIENTDGHLLSIQPCGSGSDSTSSEYDKMSENNGPDSILADMPCRPVDLILQGVSQEEHTGPDEINSAPNNIIPQEEHVLSNALPVISVPNVESFSKTEEQLAIMNLLEIKQRRISGPTDDNSNTHDDEELFHDVLQQLIPIDPSADENDSRLLDDNEAISVDPPRPLAHAIANYRTRYGRVIKKPDRYVPILVSRLDNPPPHPVHPIVQCIPQEVHTASDEINFASNNVVVPTEIEQHFTRGHSDDNSNLHDDEELFNDVLTPIDPMEDDNDSTLLDDGQTDENILVVSVSADPPRPLAPTIVHYITRYGRVIKRPDYYVPIL